MKQCCELTLRKLSHNCFAHIIFFSLFDAGDKKPAKNGSHVVSERLRYYMFVSFLNQVRFLNLFGPQEFLQSTAACDLQRFLAK